MPAIEVDEKPTWISPAIIDTEEFNTIFRFFVICSPVDGLSARQVSLADYGWNTPWRQV